MKNLLLLLCASTCFAFEAPEMKHTPLAKEIASFARHIQPEERPKGPCNYWWDKYETEKRKYGFPSPSAKNLYNEYLACIEYEKFKRSEIEDAIAEFENKIIK